MATKGLLIGGGTLIAATTVAAVYLTPLQQRRGPPAADPAPVAVTQDAAQAEAPAHDVAADPVAPEAAPAPEADAVNTDTAQGMTVDVTEPEPEPEPEVAVIPRVTERRFEPDGAFLIFGTAQPDGPVAVVVDGTEVERVDVAADGAFLVTGFLGYSDTPRRMDVISDPDGDPIKAERTYIIDANPAPVVVAAVTPEPEPTPEVALVPEADPAPEADTVLEAETAPEAEPVPQAQSDAEPTETAGVIDAEGEQSEAPTPNPDPQAELADVETPEVAAPQPESPTSPAVLAITQDGVEVVEPATSRDTSPEVMSSVALDTITYDPQGDVILGGRAQGQGFVQVYVNNAPVSRLPIDADGSWRGDLPDVDKGVYTLRIDEVDTGGDVVSRIETPFLREDPQDVIDVMAGDVQAPGFTIATRTVQPGATLWAIAEERYGAGVLYVNVFEANKDRIRDPDLIYPGQVFVIPEDAPTPSADN